MVNFKELMARAKQVNAESVPAPSPKVLDRPEDSAPPPTRVSPLAAFRAKQVEKQKQAVEVARATITVPSQPPQPKLSLKELIARAAPAARLGEQSLVEANKATESPVEPDPIDDGGIDIAESDAILESENSAWSHYADSLRPSVEPDPSQWAAVEGLAKEENGCLIGAAGTGKTTTMKLLLAALMNGIPERGIQPMRLQRVKLNEYFAAGNGKADSEDEKDVVAPSIALGAFTGQAVQVMKRNLPDAWQRNCMTIHSMLGYAPVEFTNESTGKKGIRFEPSYTKYNKMPWDIIVIDEASMTSIELWDQMMQAAKPGCRFYLIGDLNQLTPPIGLGVLGFALAVWPTFELTVVHRQADAAANRIVDTAWKVLKGEKPDLEDPATDPNWRVIGYRLDHKPDKAHQQIIAIAKGLARLKIDKSVDPSEPFVYDPWRDRIMTPMNGGDPENPNSLLGQIPLNDSLSREFASEDEVRYVIACGISHKKFAVNFRVMATKNESPSRPDRVTNGLTGKIVSITRNPDWVGDRRLVGAENEVAEHRRIMVEEALGKRNTTLNLMDEMSSALDSISAAGSFKVQEKEKGRNAGPASHIVEVVFDNGARRTYSNAAGVEQLQIAYASTTHKTQGAEMPTAIIVVHHGSARMLCRENLYTAITRASQRVVLLFTDHGLRLALGKQEIFGKDLATKIKAYQNMLGMGDSAFRTVNVRFTPYAEEQLPDVQDSYEGDAEDAYA